MSNAQLTIGDITTAPVDAIVNAANEIMLGGGGVDGAIHRAAGPALLTACHEVDAVNGVRCPTGQARITTAGDLPARYVIHTVGPRYQVDARPEQLLSSAYHNSYQLALENLCESVAVPAISCGVYGYPLKDAALIARDVSSDHAYQVLNITFYLFSQEVYDIWHEVFSRE